MEAYIILIVLIASLVWYFVHSNNQKKKKEAEYQRKIEYFKNEIEEIQSSFNENGLPVFESDVNLPKTEKLHGKIFGVEWREFRKVRTGNISGHGVTGKIKIAKGVHYRFGTGQYKVESSDQITIIDKGDLYITNKRFVFRGSKGNKNLKYSDILDQGANIDGIMIEKQTGRDVYLAFDGSKNIKNLVASSFAYQMAIAE